MTTLAGRTTDNRPVISGIGALTTTHGLPLEIVLFRFQELGQVVDWADYISTCLKDGHKPQTIRSRVLAAVGDVHGAAYLVGFAPWLDATLARLA